MSSHNPEFINVMIDLETLGLKPGCTILSIGATPFQVSLTHARKYTLFYEKISRTASEQFGFKEDESTMRWWETQSAAAKAEAFSGTLSPETALLKFSDWCAKLNAKIVVWGNSASFDIKILEAAYNLCGIQVPWHYHDEMCFRTLKRLFNYVEIPVNTDKHNALSDARHQAAHADAILDFLRSRGVFNGIS